MSAHDHKHDPLPPPGAEDYLLEPHGHEEHSHHISSKWTLLAVLMVLLAFTVLTVAVSRAEGWASHYFDIDIPQWINAAVALSIAVVKGTLVALFFMHLKSDNRLNAIIFGFCLFALGLFLVVTMDDMRSRGAVYRWKADPIVLGGTGANTITKRVGAERVPLTEPITAFSRKNYIQNHDLAGWAAEMAHHVHHYHGEKHLHHLPPAERTLVMEELRKLKRAHGEDHGSSDSNHARPRSGLLLFADDGHDAHETHKPGAAGH